MKKSKPVTPYKHLDSVDGDKFLSIEEASAYSNVKGIAIRNYLYLEKLTKYKFKNLVLIDKSELDKYIEQRDNRGKTWSH